MELARPTVATECAHGRLNCETCVWQSGFAREVLEAHLPSMATTDPRSIDCVTCNHLWMREEWFVVYGTVLTGAEATELPWRRRKDHELATPNEIRRDLELVQALYVRGTNQGPSAFDEVKLYLREDIG